MAPSVATILVVTSMLMVPSWAGVRRDNTYCLNTNGVALNNDNKDCLSYPLSTVGACSSSWDDADFTAEQMCCACGGGAVSQVPTYVGCFADSVNNRAFPVRIGTSGISLEQCAGACFAANHTYFGRQWDEECYCGNSSYNKLGAADGCRCNATNIGGDMNCVYNFTQATTAMCADPDERLRGSDGNGCGHYYWAQTENAGKCAANNDEDFNATSMCCACGGGSAKADGWLCFEANITSADSQGNLCQWYHSDTLACGRYDTIDFIANASCCACGGGRQELSGSTAASATATTSQSGTSTTSAAARNIQVTGAAADTSAFVAAAITMGAALVRAVF